MVYPEPSGLPRQSTTGCSEISGQWGWRKKADMRARIIHVIDLLSKWSSAVKPPEKGISAHDAMGGGDVMGGGEYGGNNGWSYSSGKWPNLVQPQQTHSSCKLKWVPFRFLIQLLHRLQDMLTFVIGLRMTTLQIFLLPLLFILDKAVPAIVKIFLSLLITIGSIRITLTFPFDLEVGIPLPILLIGRRRTTTITFPQVLEFHEPILIH